MHLELEPQLLRIEGDRGIDVVDDVANLDGGHRAFLFLVSPGAQPQQAAFAGLDSSDGSAAAEAQHPPFCASLDSPW
jgi:hypothetical protein